MPPALIRTRATWLLYAVNGVSAFFVYSVGPATPLIADDLGITPQVAALHGTAMAAALLTAGALAGPTISRWGRRHAIVGALLVMAVGVLAVLVAPVLPVSLLGAFIAGAGGAVAAVAANATLADAHPDVAPTVLTEANGTAAWVGLFAPLLMGVFLTIGLGWRVGLALSAPLCLAMAWAIRGRGHGGRGRGASGPPVAGEASGAGRTAEDRALEIHSGRALAAVVSSGSTAVAGADTGRGPGTAPGPRVERSDRGVPRAIWVVMIGVSAAAGAEFAVNYWGSSLLLENTGATVGTVTAAMSAPVAGVAVGRTLGARLALHLPAHAMLVGGWLIGLIGFAVFWRAGAVPLAAVGLFVVGLGISVIYPLLLDRAVLLMPDQSDRAMALAMPFLGVAIGLAPFGLGAVAGQVGVVTAFLVVPVIMVVGLAAVLGSRPRSP